MGAARRLWAQQDTTRGTGRGGRWACREGGLRARAGRAIGAIQEYKPFCREVDVSALNHVLGVRATPPLASPFGGRDAFDDERLERKLRSMARVPKVPAPPSCFPLPQPDRGASARAQVDQLPTGEWVALVETGVTMEALFRALAPHGLRPEVRARPARPPQLQAPPCLFALFVTAVRERALPLSHTATLHTLSQPHSHFTHTLSATNAPALSRRYSPACGA